MHLDYKGNKESSDGGEIKYVGEGKVFHVKNYPPLKENFAK